MRKPLLFFSKISKEICLSNLLKSVAQQKGGFNVSTFLWKSIGYLFSWLKRGTKRTFSLFKQIFKID